VQLAVRQETLELQVLRTRAGPTGQEASGRDFPPVLRFEEDGADNTDHRNERPGEPLRPASQDHIYPPVLDPPPEPRSRRGVNDGPAQTDLVQLMDVTQGRSSQESETQLVPCSEPPYQQAHVGRVPSMTLPEPQHPLDSVSGLPSTVPADQARPGLEQGLSQHASQHQQVQQPPSKTPRFVYPCDACRRSGKDCIRSTPCDTCFFEKRVCVWPDVVSIPRAVRARTRCRECRYKEAKCDKEWPCRRCLRSNAVCTYTELTEACGECLSWGLRKCYASSACDNCIESGQRCFSGDDIQPACVPCQDHGLLCDRLHPCSRCKCGRTVCRYPGSVQSSGTSTAQPSTAIASLAMSVPDTHSLPQRACTACLKQHKACNGLDPCNNCENSYSVCEYDGERAGSSQGGIAASGEAPQPG
jgi:hypothetical protein